MHVIRPRRNQFRLNILGLLLLCELTCTLRPKKKKEIVVPEEALSLLLPFIAQRVLWVKLIYNTLY